MIRRQKKKKIPTLGGVGRRGKKSASGLMQKGKSGPLWDFLEPGRPAQGGGRMKNGGRKAWEVITQREGPEEERCRKGGRHFEQP